MRIHLLVPNRRFRFSLRLLFVVTTVFGLLLTWVLAERYTSQQEFDIAVRFAGDAFCVRREGPFYSEQRDLESRPQGWWRSAAEFAWGRRVVGISVHSNAITDLRPLAELPRLRWLSVSATSIENLAPLAGLRQLQTLDIEETNVTSLTPLQGLHELRSINAYGTGIHDLTPIANLRKLEYLNVAATRATTLTTLARLKSLKILDISAGTPVSDAQLQELHKHLPDCVIKR